MLDPTSQIFSRLTTLSSRDGDTATPRHIVPVYFVHTLEEPFCLNPHCECHQNQEQIARLLVALVRGEMTLREAADFSDCKAL